MIGELGVFLILDVREGGVVYWELVFEYFDYVWIILEGK